MGVVMCCMQRIWRRSGRNSVELGVTVTDHPNFSTVGSRCRHAACASPRENIFKRNKEKILSLFSCCRKQPPSLSVCNIGSGEAQVFSNNVLIERLLVEGKVLAILSIHQHEHNSASVPQSNLQQLLISKIALARRRVRRGGAVVQPRQLSRWVPCLRYIAMATSAACADHWQHGKSQVIQIFNPIQSHNCHDPVASCVCAPARCAVWRVVNIVMSPSVRRRFTRPPGQWQWRR